MNKVLLISPNNESNPTVFPIGLGYIRSGLLKSGFDAGILDFAHLEFKNEVLKLHLNEYKPDFIGISIRNMDNCCYLHTRSFISPIKKIVGWIREWNPLIPVILGGSGFSLLPQIWMQVLEADFGIVGDGTKSFPGLLNYLKDMKEPKDLPGLIYYKKGRCIGCPAEQAEIIDEIPFPTRDGFIHPLKEDRNVRYNIQTKRGCSFQCTYCAYPLIEGENLRLRSPKNVVDEICEMFQEHHVKEFDFVDNVFNNPMGHAEDICREIISRKIKVSWSCFLNPVNCSQEFLKLLIDAGCTHVEFGIDSGSEKILKAMKKNFSKNDICTAVENCKKVKISFNCCILFGGTGETMETVRETFQLMDRLEVEQVFGLIGIRILPNTALHLQDSKKYKVSELLEPKFYISEEIQPAQIINEFQTLYKRKYPGWTIL